MTHQEFQEWLSRYKAARETRNHQAAANTFSLDAKYDETPFSSPFTGREQIFNYWADVPRYQDQILHSFQILAVDDRSGIVQWRPNLNACPPANRFSFMPHADQ